METATTLHLTDWAELQAHDCTAARQRITISALSCLPPKTKTPGAWPRLWAAWADAAGRGIKVTLYLPAPSAIHPASFQNGQTAIKAHAAGIKCHMIKGPRLLHCKSIAIDENICWIGSGNFTSAAAHHNLEAYTRTISAEMVEQLLKRWKEFT